MVSSNALERQRWRGLSRADRPHKALIACLGGDQVKNDLEADAALAYAPPMIDPDILAEIDAFLHAWPDVTLATSDLHGQPQAATVGVAVTPERGLVFDTLDSTRKYPNLIANPKVALVIGWDATGRTIQYQGEATLLTPGTPDFDRYQTIYLARFPGGRERLTWPGLCYFHVRPTWIRYSDFRTPPPRLIELAGPTLEPALA